MEKIKKVEKQLKKAGKEIVDIQKLHNQIESGKAQMNKALKNLKDNGFNTVTNTKIKRFSDLGRTITDPFTPAGAIGVAQTSGPNGTQTGVGTAIIQRPYSKHKLENSRYGKKEHTGITKRYKAENSVDKIQSKYYPNRKWTDESATKALKKDNVKLTDLELKAAKRSINGKWTDGMYHPSYEHLYNYEKKRRGLK